MPQLTNVKELKKLIKLQLELKDKKTAKPVLEQLDNLIKEEFITQDNVNFILNNITTTKKATSNNNFLTFSKPSTSNHTEITAEDESARNLWNHLLEILKDENQKQKQGENLEESYNIQQIKLKITNQKDSLKIKSIMDEHDIFQHGDSLKELKESLRKFEELNNKLKKVNANAVNILKRKFPGHINDNFFLEGKSFSDNPIFKDKNKANSLITLLDENKITQVDAEAIITKSYDELEPTQKNICSVIDNCKIYEKLKKSFATEGTTNNVTNLFSELTRTENTSYDIDDFFHQSHYIINLTKSNVFKFEDITTALTMDKTELETILHALEAISRELTSTNLLTFSKAKQILDKNIGSSQGSDKKTILEAFHDYIINNLTTSNKKAIDEEKLNNALNEAASPPPYAEIEKEKEKQPSAPTITAEELKELEMKLEQEQEARQAAEAKAKEAEAKVAELQKQLEEAEKAAQKAAEDAKTIAELQKQLEKVKKTPETVVDISEAPKVPEGEPGVNVSGDKNQPLTVSSTKNNKEFALTS